MNRRYTKDGRTRKLRLSSKRKVNKGKNLAAWRIRVKELAAQKEAGILSDLVQEETDVEQNLSLVQSTSNVQTNSDLPNSPENATITDTNIANPISNNPQDINSSQIPISSVAIESPSTVQQTSIKQPNDPVLRTPQKPNSTDISGLLEDINSSQVPISSASVELCNTPQTVSKDDSFTLPLVTSADTNSLPVISNSGSDSLSKTLSSDNSSLPVFSSSLRDSNTRLVIPKDHPSILPIISPTQKGAIPQQRVLRSYATQLQLNCNSVATPLPLKCNSVATQINYDTLKIPKRSKRHKFKKLKLLPKDAPVEGRRIIDFQYFFKALKAVNNHSKDGKNRSKSGCNLNNIFITEEKKSGICTYFYLKCSVCNFRKTIWCESPCSMKKDLTADFVSGMFKIKCNFDDANVLLSELHLPLLSHSYFVEEYEKASKVDNNKTQQNTVENFGENGQLEPRIIAVQPCSTALGDSNLSEKVDLGDLVVEDQFEIKEESCIENESENAISDQTLRITEDELTISQEHVTLNTATIKQEIISDDEDFTSSITNETANKKSVAVENNKHSNVVIKSEFDEIEMTNNESTVDFDDKPESELPLKKKAKTVSYEELNNPAYSQGILTPSKEINLLQNESTCESKELAAAISTSEDNVTTMSTTNTDNTTASPSAAVMLQGGGNATFIPVQHLPKPNGNEAVIVSQMPHNMSNGTYPGVKGAVFIPGKSAAVQPHIGQSNGGLSPLINMQRSWSDNFSATFNNIGQSNSGLLPLINMQQSWTDGFSTTVNNPLILFPGASGTAYMSGVPVTCQFTKPTSNIAIPQPASLANSHPIASGSTYVPLASAAIQQPVNSSSCMPRIIPDVFHQPVCLSNVVQSAGETSLVSFTPAIVHQPADTSVGPPVNTDVSFTPSVDLQPADLSARPPNGTEIQQPADSSARPPVNIDGSRWIGRANMSSNNPFCTLPGGTPKGVSDLVPHKSNSDQYNQQSKRPRFRCDDCDVSFDKHESWDSHKKLYCIKRLKLPPSSTVTNNTLMNHLLLPNDVTPSFKPHIEELLSAMAVKRSLLETSIKTALDAQYVINLHKSAQVLTQKSYKELDNALNREKALIPESSLEEQQIVSEARVQALMRAEAAYKQEKHSAAAVEQALYRQKTAIEATLAATGHEQTTLISTLKKVQENPDDICSMIQGLYNANFNQEKILGTSLVQMTEQVVDSTSSKSSIHKAYLFKSDSFVEQKNKINTISHARSLQNASHLQTLNRVNFEESKAVNFNILPNDSSESKEINKTSHTISKISSFQSYKNRLPHDYFHPQKVLNLNVTTKAATSSISKYEKENMFVDYSHLQELRYLNARFFSNNTHDTEKCFTQRVKSDEMMDVNIAPSNENIHVLANDIEQDSVFHNFVHERRKMNDSSCTLTKEDPQSQISLSVTLKESSYIHDS